MRFVLKVGYPSCGFPFKNDPIWLIWGSPSLGTHSGLPIRSRYAPNQAAPYQKEN